MTEIGPGTQLICVHAEPAPEEPKSLTEGAIYTCEAVHMYDDDGSDLPCFVCGQIVCESRIHIVGKTIDYFFLTFPHCFCASRFRPLNDGDTSLVEGETTINDAKKINLPDLVTVK